ncbi:MAG TPA: FAD-dependent oxidoreductase [Steroidobacteraceae bacterium]|nr:FAD-dependent oxidoreductase [Steroidobacteraceae bacterium]
MSAALQSHARVVVIGGGAVGCSALYHLTRLGCTDVVLLERDELTAGSTWHAAGNCPNFSTAWSILKLQHYSTELYAHLAQEVGYEINYHRTGSLRLAHSADRVDEFRHVIAQARAQGMEFELLSPAQIRARHPFLELGGIRAALWDPGDGDLDPAQLTQALAKGARERGASIHRHTRVLGIRQLSHGGWRLETSGGVIEAEYVINAAGYRGGEVAAMIGEYLPVITLSHQYLVTQEIPALVQRGAARLPLLRDPDVSYYLRQERHGLLLGPYEAHARAHWVEGLPADFAHQLFADDLGRIEAYIEAACARVPLLGTVGVRRVINGPIPYAPDGNPLIGPARGAANFFHCCAFTFGIVQAGGAGRIIADWVLKGQPDWDVWPLDTRRYLPFADRSYALAKALETYQHEYAVSYPQEERPAGRPAKTSPLHERLRAAGAVFGARGGWERAVYFPRPEDPGGPESSFRRPHWHRAVARECAAVAGNVALLDLPGFAKFEVAGAGAAAWLDHLIAGALPREGRVALSYLCSARGGIVTELTVTHLPGGRFWLMGAAAGERHDEEWLREHLTQRHGPVSLVNRTAQYGTLIVAGPRSRELLMRLTRADLSNEGFPWLAARSMRLAGAQALVARVNYVGELGWELHLANEDLAAIHALLTAAGGEFALAPFGLYAMESLRLEKCYRSWKADLTSEYTPLMASLERFVRLDKGADFIGRDALRREAEAGPRERFVPLLVEDGDADASAVSVLYSGGAVVGLVTSGGYGYRINRSIALGYVRRDLAVSGTELEVEILGVRRRAVVAREPLYDPQNLRLRS